MPQVIIANLKGSPLSLDFKVGDVVIRKQLGVGVSFDVGKQISIDDLNQSDDVKALVAKSYISVTSTAESDDIAEDAVLSSSRLVVGTTLTSPILASTNRIVTAVDWGDGTLSIAAQPDCPRNVTVALTDVNNSITGGTLTITGKDTQGNNVVETMTPDGLGGGKTLTGTKIFAQVTSVVIAGTTGVVGAGADQLIVGVGNVIGLPSPITATTAVKHVYLGGTRVASPTLTAGVSTSGVDASSGTYNGSKLLQVFYNTAG